MAIRVFNDIEQGSEQWFACRAGIPTSSKFHTVMASGRGGGESKTRRQYLLTLVGECLTGECVEGYSNAAMERGHAMEDEARARYELQSDEIVQRCGFIRNDLYSAGASPDGLIGDDGMIEIKTKLPHLQLEAILDGALPAEHKAQCQGALWVSGRKWLRFVSYWPKLPLFSVLVERDERYIAGLKVAVEDFNAELKTLVERFR